MAIEFNQIVISNLPFIQAEISKRINTSGSVKQEYTCLIIGQKTSIGTANPEAIYDIFSTQEAIAKFGANSMLSRAVDGYLKSNKSVKLKVVALDDLAIGTQATGTLTISGTSTSAGTISFYIDGRFYRVPVSVGDTEVQIATILNNVINADETSLVTSSFALGVVTITSVHKGTFGNSLKMMMNYNSDEVTPAGITTSIVDMSSGSGDPDLTNFVVPLLEENQYNLIAQPYTDNANLILMKDALTDNFLATQMLDSLVLFSKEDTVTNMITKIEAINSPFIHSEDGANSFINPLEFLSITMGYVSDIAQNNPGAGYLNVELKGILALPQRIRTERNVLAGSGVSTFKTNGTSVIIEKMVSTYTKDAQGISDDAFRELRTILTLSYVRHSFIVRMAQFQNFKLGNDEDTFGTGARVMTPNLYAENLTFVYQQLIDDAVCENLALFEESLITEKVGNRINSRFSINLINILEQQAMSIEFQL